MYWSDSIPPLGEVLLAQFDHFLGNIDAVNLISALGNLQCNDTCSAACIENSCAGLVGFLQIIDSNIFSVIQDNIIDHAEL